MEWQKSALCNIFDVTFKYSYCGYRKFKIHKSCTEAKRGRQQIKVSIDFCCVFELD